MKGWNKTIQVLTHTITKTTALWRHCFHWSFTLFQNRSFERERERERIMQWVTSAQAQVHVQDASTTPTMMTTSSQPSYHQPTSVEEVRTLWIGDLQYWVDENYLHNCFAHTGEVLSLSLSIYIYMYVCVCVWICLFMCYMCVKFGNCFQIQRPNGSLKVKVSILSCFLSSLSISWCGFFWVSIFLMYPCVCACICVSNLVIVFKFRDPIEVWKWNSRFWVVCYLLCGFPDVVFLGFIMLFWVGDVYEW